MKKMVKRYSFKIGELERRAILYIRRNDINVSRYLRYSLRKLQQLLQQKYKQGKDEYVNIQIKNENDLKKYRFLLEDFDK
jgi:hypothetical protein